MSQPALTMENYSLETLFLFFEATYAPLFPLSGKRAFNNEHVIKAIHYEGLKYEETNVTSWHKNKVQYKMLFSYENKHYQLALTKIHNRESNQKSFFFEAIVDKKNYLSQLEINDLLKQCHLSIHLNGVIKNSEPTLIQDFINGDKLNLFRAC